jgi:uncharacterized NAD-dependent epimerase/dehydratase family protein
MKSFDGNAVIYCEGAFRTTYGKTAHGLVRFTERYRVLAVVDSNCAGEDAGMILDGKAKNIPIFASVNEAVEAARKGAFPATHLVIGLAPDGGHLSPIARQAVLTAIYLGLNVDSGLHDYLSEDAEMVAAAAKNNVKLRDVRKSPPIEALHFFSGKIEAVKALKIAVLGTDSAVGKRTTAWLLVHGFRDAQISAEMVGTGQTAWMQGARYGLILDTTVNDFLAGEIEHAVWSAWNEQSPQVIVVEGQGSLLNPAYPGGYELLAAARPDLVILQHAPSRIDYDGFPGYPIEPLSKQIQAIEFIAGKPVVAITLNHEGMSKEEVRVMCQAIKQVTGLPTFDVLLDGAAGLIETLRPFLKK